MAEATVKRVRVAEPSNQATAEAEAAEMMAEVVVDEAARAGKRPKAAAAIEQEEVEGEERKSSAPDVLSPSAIVAALRAPMPNVLKYLCEERKAMGAVISEQALNEATTASHPPQRSDSENDTVELHINCIPMDVDEAELTVAFASFRVVPDSVRLWPAEKEGMQRATMTVSDAAAALEVLSSTHRLGRSRLVQLQVSVEPRTAQAPCRKLHIGGFDSWVTATHLTNFFAAYGDLATCAVIMSTAIHNDFRFAFVEFASVDHARHAYNTRRRAEEAFGPKTRVLYARAQGQVGR